MAMSDCVNCWNTPCTCGYDYRDWTKAAREELAAAVLGVQVKTLQAVADTPEVHPKMTDEDWDRNKECVL